MTSLLRRAWDKLPRRVAHSTSATIGELPKQVDLTPKEEGRVPPTPALPPGLKGWILGHAGFLKKDPTSRQTSLHRLFELRTGWYEECNSKTIMVNLVGQQRCFCADPTVYREILGEKQGSFTNSNAFRDIVGYMFPRSMIVLEGPDWQRVRRVSQKAINRMNMDLVVEGAAEVYDLAAKNNAFREDEDVNTYKVMSFMTFDIFHKVMYSFDPKMVNFDPSNPNIKLLEACEGLLGGIRDRLFTIHLKFMWGFPTKANRELAKCQEHIVNMGKQIIEERRIALRNENAPRDAKTRSLLDGLIVSQDEEILNDKEVTDQIATFFFGAYETTSNTLLFTLNSLASKPDVQTRLREELKKRFPGGSADIKKAKVADLDSVQYLLWTLDESFRLHPTAFAVPRDVIQDVVVGGYALKKGTGVNIDHRIVSRDPFFYQGQKDLDEFNPGRYEKYPLTDKVLSLPFGFGARLCPGRRIAIAETKTLIALIVSDYEVLPPKDPSKVLIEDSQLGLTCLNGTGFLRFRKL